MINQQVDNIIKKQFLNEFVYSYMERIFSNITSKDAEDLTLLYFLIRRFYSMFGLLSLQEEHFVFKDEIVNFFKLVHQEEHDNEKAKSFIEKVGNTNSMQFAQAFTETDDINIYFQTEEYFIFLREIAKDFESSIYLGFGGKYKQALQILRNTLELMLTAFVKRFINPERDIKLNNSIKEWENFNWGLPSMSSLLNFISTNPKIDNQLKLKIQFLREIFNSATHTKRSKIFSEKKFKHIQNIDENTFYNEWIMTFLLTLFVEIKVFIAILRDADLEKNADLLKKSLDIVETKISQRLEAFLIGCHDLYIIDNKELGYFLDFSTGKGLGIFVIETIDEDAKNNIIQKLNDENARELAGTFHIRIYDQDFNLQKNSDIGYVNENKEFFIVSFFFQKNRVEILKIAKIYDLNEKQHFEIEEYFIKRHYKNIKDKLSDEKKQSDDDNILDIIFENLFNEIKTP